MGDMVGLPDRYLPYAPQRFFYRMDEKAPMGLPDDDWGGSYQSIQVRAFSSW